LSTSGLKKALPTTTPDQQAFDAAGHAAALMRKYGVQRRVVSRDELLQIEPGLRGFADQIVGGTYTPSDESGDARVFTQALARRCAERGVQFMYGHDVLRLQASGGTLDHVVVRDRATRAEARCCVAMPWWWPAAPTARRCCARVGVDLPIYPGKGYSATFASLRPEAAPSVSVLDDEVKCAVSRLGNTLRVAGTIELNGYDLSLDTPLARARCDMLARRVAQVFPGVCDTRTRPKGGNPRFWTGPAPRHAHQHPVHWPDPVRGLWVNAGHGTLGWTHGAGSGKAMAELIGGRVPAIGFGFLGADRVPQRPRAAATIAA
jgi:D-amino-acid dehydrogenase